MVDCCANIDIAETLANLTPEMPEIDEDAVLGLLFWHAVIPFGVAYVFSSFLELSNEITTLSATATEIGTLFYAHLNTPDVPPPTQGAAPGGPIGAPRPRVPGIRERINSLENADQIPALITGIKGSYSQQSMLELTNLLLEKMQGIDGIEAHFEGIMGLQGDLIALGTLIKQATRVREKAPREADALGEQIEQWKQAASQHLSPQQMNRLLRGALQSLQEAQLVSGVLKSGQGMGARFESLRLRTDELRRQLAPDFDIVDVDGRGNCLYLSFVGMVDDRLRPLNEQFRLFLRGEGDNAAFTENLKSGLTWLIDHIGENPEFAQVKEQAEARLANFPELSRGTIEQTLRLISMPAVAEARQRTADHLRQRYTADYALMRASEAFLELEDQGAFDALKARSAEWLAEFPDLNAAGTAKLQALLGRENFDEETKTAARVCLRDAGNIPNQLHQTVVEVVELIAKRRPGGYPQAFKALHEEAIAQLNQEWKTACGETPWEERWEQIRPNYASDFFYGKVRAFDKGQAWVRPRNLEGEALLAEIRRQATEFGIDLAEESPFSQAVTRWNTEWEGSIERRYRDWLPDAKDHLRDDMISDFCTPEVVGTYIDQIVEWNHDKPLEEGSKERVNVLWGDGTTLQAMAEAYNVKVNLCLQEGPVFAPCGPEQPEEGGAAFEAWDALPTYHIVRFPLGNHFQILIPKEVKPPEDPA